MPAYLLVPVQLDVLQVIGDTHPVAGPLVDFTQLPWVGASLDNKKRPYLSETISENSLGKIADNYPLQPGLHFHWSLPTALTKTTDIQILYKQTFISIFGEQVAEEIWKALMDYQWLRPLHEKIGTAIVTLPDENDLPAKLSGTLAQNWYDIYKLLRSSNFPAAPNRWLIKRSTKKTIIESDYLWPEGTEQDPAGRQPMSDYYSVFPQLSEDPQRQPYRYMGRAYEPGAQLQGAAEHLANPLTAAGYGEPGFAAYYPHCRSVFGHYDEQALASDDEFFELLGWYEDPEQDYFRVFTENFIQNWKKDHQTTDIKAVNPQSAQLNYLYLDLLDAVYRRLRIEIPVKAPQDKLQNIKAATGTNAWDALRQALWLDDAGLMLPKSYAAKTVLAADLRTQEATIRTALNEAARDQFPQQLILYAGYTGAEDADHLPKLEGKNIQVAVGNSPTEALSALLAQSLSPAKKEIVEDQLESIQFASKLEHITVDTGPIFEELRHEKQFTAVEGGRIWEIKARKETGKKADQVADEAPETLPSELAEDLNQLNLLEEERDQNGAAIGSLRRQIYADWCWFLKNEHKYKLMQADADKGAYGEQNNGGYGDQGGDDYGDQNTANQGVNSGPEAVEQMKLFLDRTKAFIFWEINTLLRERLDRDNTLQGQLAPQQQKVQAGLQQYRYDAQFLTLNDINQWDAFVTILGKENKLMSILPANARTSDKQAYLLAINEALAALKDALPYPSPDKPEEATELEAQLRESGIPDALRDSLRLRLNRLALEAYFPDQIKHRPRYELQPQPAGRYWRPNDPVVFVGGLDATPRYQAPGDTSTASLLTLNAAPNVSAPGTLEQLAVSVKNAVSGVTASQPRADWHPLFLNWQVGFQQASVRQEMGEELAYKPDYLQQNFSLGNNDFSPGQALQYDDQLGFNGHCILTPGAGIQVKKNIADRLVSPLLDQFYRDTGITTDPTMAQFKNWLKDKVGIDASVTEQIKPDPDELPKTQIAEWLEAELNRQTPTNRQLMKYWIGQLSKEQPIVLQFSKEAAADDIEANTVFETFLGWAEERIHLKARYTQTQQTDKTQLLDLLLLYNEGERNKFTRWLKGKLGAGLDRYFMEMAVPTELQADYLNDHYEDLICWFQPQVDEALHLVVEIEAFQKLLDISGLSQSLGGFADALVKRRQDFQVPILHPFPYDGDTGFVKMVRAAVLAAGQTAPANDLPFSPWRAGRMRITGFSLVDNFGRHLDVADPAKESIPTPITASTLPLTDSTIGLPPRLLQPARLDFRWLSADTGTEEASELPAAGPVCGWVMPNNLDDSLMFYSAAGDALGYIDEGGHWRTFPGNTGPVTPADIADSHLAQMVQWLVDQHRQHEGFTADFITTLDIAQENMAPENFAQQEALAFLVGKPLALVRADLRFRLRELPAIHYSEDRITTDVNDYDKYAALSDSEKRSTQPPVRDTFHFEHVQVPLRLGEYHRLNDGLVGYWVESDGKYQADKFYAPQTSPPKEGLPANIITRHNGAGEDAGETQFLFQLSAAQEQPITVSMLMDPRAPVHATTGLLPVKALQLPPNQYMLSLQRLQVAFLTAPLLTPVENLQISLPLESGFEWSWVQKEGQQWSVLSAQGMVAKHQLTTVFGAQAELLWAALLQQGWLEIADTDTARILPKDQRPAPPDPDPLAGFREAMDVLLTQLSIQPFDTAPRFDLTQVLREGWLRLSPKA